MSNKSSTGVTPSEATSVPTVDTASTPAAGTDHGQPVGISRFSRVITHAGAHSAEEILTSLYVTEHEKVVHAIARSTKSIDDAEDLAQEVFISVGEALKRQSISSPAAYLWTAVANRIKNWRRNRREAVSLDADDSEFVRQTADSAEDEMCANTRAEALLGAIAGLTPAQLDAYGHVDLRGYTESEAAAILGVSRSTVSTLRSRALIELKDEYLLADSC